MVDWGSHLSRRRWLSTNSTTELLQQELWRMEFPWRIWIICSTSQVVFIFTPSHFGTMFENWEKSSELTSWQCPLLVVWVSFGPLLSRIPWLSSNVFFYVGSGQSQLGGYYHKAFLVIRNEKNCVLILRA